MNNADLIPSRIVKAIMGGCEWLEDLAKRGGTITDQDKATLLQCRARLMVLCRDFHNNRQGLSRRDHNQLFNPR